MFVYGYIKIRYVVVCLKRSIHVSGMTCRSCETLLREAALEVDGISEARADLNRGVLEVVARDDYSVRKVVQAVSENGYSVEGVD